MPYLSASAVVIHYEKALYQVYAPLPFKVVYVDMSPVVCIKVTVLRDQRLWRRYASTGYHSSFHLSVLSVVSAFHADQLTYCYIH